MKKIVKIGMVLILLAAIGFSGIVSDRITLRDNLIRLHVVGASDSEFDQDLKRQVRDGITAYLQPLLDSCGNAREAQALIEGELSNLQKIADDILLEGGCAMTADATLQLEEFPVRHYDSFSLPSGVYRALRIQIGPAQGRNWWCVVFPSLCFGTGEELNACAAGAGFDDTLTQTLTKPQEYEIRFFLLDVLGSLENFLFPG